MNRLKCLFGYHKEKWTKIEGTFNTTVYMECQRCKKKGVWLPLVNAAYWTRDLKRLPADFKKYIAGDFPR